MRMSVRFRLTHLMIAVAVFGTVFAIWPHLETRPSLLENLPQVKLGMSEAEVESLIGTSGILSIGGGMKRATHHFSGGGYYAEVVFWLGEGVTEVRLDGKLITPLVPPNRFWANMIEEHVKKTEQGEGPVVAPPERD